MRNNLLVWSSSKMKNFTMWRIYIFYSYTEKWKHKREPLWRAYRKVNNFRVLLDYRFPTLQLLYTCWTQNAIYLSGIIRVPLVWHHYPSHLSTNYNLMRKQKMCWLAFEIECQSHWLGALICRVTTPSRN